MVPDLKRLLVILPLLLLSLMSSATHLIGGYMSYEYLTTLPDGKLRFKVRLDLYRDCKSVVDFDQTIRMGVYQNTGNFPLYTLAQFSWVGQPRKVTPPGTVDCQYYDENVCVEYALYEGIVDLPPSSTGYHITFARCCRNDQDNLLNGASEPYQGQTYYCFIPDYLYQNSSPIFSGIPSPYMCAGDTTVFDFSAYDKDGDKLTYRLVHPYAGASLADPEPTPANNYSPPNLVEYQTNYTWQQPFGTLNGSYTTVDAVSGLTTIYAPSAGSYVMAVEVTEERDGVVLSRVRMDLQILVLPCPPNKPPKVEPQDGQTFLIQEGETLCFDVNGTDPDNDDSNPANDNNVYLTAKGPIYDGSNNYSGPRATFTTVQNTDGTAEGTFCWTPDCDMDREEPYIVRIVARDDGCPPKFHTEDFLIYVEPFEGADEIDGPTDVCQYNQVVYRAIGGSAGSTYEWTVDNGFILGKIDSSVITVIWDQVGLGTISMTEISQYGCPGDTVSLDVQVNASPPLPQIQGKDTVCEGEFGLIYTTSSYTATHTYEWFVENAVIAGTATNSMTLFTYSAPKFIVKVVESNADGCSSDTAFFEVFVSQPYPDISGPDTVCPNALNIRYETTAASGSSYTWQATGHRQLTEQGNAALIDWGNAGLGSVSVRETDRFGCVSPVVSMTVTKTYTLGIVLIDGPDEVCENDLAVEYRSDEVNGMSYYWNILGGNQVSGDTSWRIGVDWGAAGAGSVTVQQSAWDLVNDRQCLSGVTTLPVTIHPRPVADEIVGSTVLCQSSGNYSYQINGFAGSSYIWRIDGDSSGITGQGGNQISIDWDEAGTFVLSVIELSAAGCPGTLVDTIITVNPKPQTAGINGPDVICPEDPLGKVYDVSGMTGSTYFWALSGHLSFSGQGSDQITVDWDTTQALGVIKVLETSDRGCEGDTLQLQVTIDRLALDMRFISVGDPDDRMQIDWQYVVPSSTSQFTIQKRAAGSGSWQDVATVSGAVTDYLETGINSDLNAWEYRVIATNGCGTQVSTEVHRSILLTGTQDEDLNILTTFTAYEGWDQGVDFYTHYESVNYSPFDNQQFANPGDVIVSLKDSRDYRKCYKIRAQELGGEQTESWSNQICFTYAPNVYVPTAITVNNDGLNDVFRVATLAVKDITITVFNRWGEQLFETTDIDGYWDATYKGVGVQQGVYLYSVKFSDFEDKLYHKTGTFTVLK